MTNAFGVVLDSASLRRATIEGVSETVIAAIYFLHERSVDEIVAKLRPSELEQVIKLVGRCPSCYPPGTLAALKDRRRLPSPQPQPAERINPGPERLRCRSATERATTNPYGITLDRAWSEWAAKRGVSETVAAALYVLSENRKAEDVVGKLSPSELEQVIDIIGHQPDRFPPGTLAALKESRPTPPEVSSDPRGGWVPFPRAGAASRCPAARARKRRRCECGRC
jgi:hypothetical protein